MAPWNWTWEESSRAENAPVLLETHETSALTPRQKSSTRSGAPAATTGGPPQPPASKRPHGAGGGPRRPNYHRRRLGAAIALAALAIALIALALSAGGASNARGRTAKLSSKHTSARPARAPSAEPTPAAEEAAINHVFSYTPAVTEGADKGNEVALTFDDGPGPYTIQLVETLNRLHVHATFFAIGEMERYFSAGTRLELRSGDVVGDHTETHPFLVEMSASQQHEEMLNQMLRIELLGGPRPRLFRPPYGSFDSTTFRELAKLHLLTILWSTDTEDFKVPGVQTIVHNALAGAHPGAIILMHDGGGNRAETIAALPAIISGLRRRGLHPVTVPRLLLDDPPQPGQPVPTSLAGD